MIEPKANANGKISSRKKRPKKAATPRPSITSSTTAGKATKKASGGRKPPGYVDEENANNKTDKASGQRQLAGLVDEENAFECGEEFVPLTPSQQSQILELLYRGASPALACGQVEVSVERFLRMVAEDASFRAKVRDITGILSGNVMAVMYRTAMEGNVSAQQAWLKLFPPPTFAEPAEAEPMTFDELLGDLSDAELVELARAVGVDLPHEVEANLDAEGLSYLTEQISQRFAIDGP